MLDKLCGRNAGGFKVKRTFRRKREQLLRLKTEDEEAYNIILSQGCPDYYGLPSFDDTKSCAFHTCEQCWEEALYGKRKREI